MPAFPHVLHILHQAELSSTTVVIFVNFPLGSVAVTFVIAGYGFIAQPTFPIKLGKEAARHAEFNLGRNTPADSEGRFPSIRNIERAENPKDLPTNPYFRHE